jgi:hypothetical protein
MPWSGPGDRGGVEDGGTLLRLPEGCLSFWDRVHEGHAGRWPEGPGGQALASLYAGGIVEPAWAVVHPAGFEWWASSQAQRVGVTDEQTLEGLRVSRLLLEADLCTSLPDTAEARLQVDLLNQHATLSAVVASEDGGLVLAASLLVHEKNMAWTRRILPPLFALQAAEAGAMAAALGALGAAPATSAHPNAGPRVRTQATLGELASQVLAREAAPPLDPRIFEDVAASVRNVGLVARADKRGLDVEMPFAGETALLQMLGPLQHPAVGDGVLCVLVLPVLALRHALAGEGLPALLARLNAQARSPKFHAESLPALGGWAPDPNSGHPALATFVPSLLAADEVLTDLAMAQLARALLLARCFDDCGEDAEALSRALAAAV